MADTKISGLTALTGANVDTAADVLAIVDDSVTTTKKITAAELAIALGRTTGTQASTFTWNGSGGSTGSVTMTYQKIGNFVTLNIPALSATTGTNSNTLTADTALPAAIRPAATQDCPANSNQDNGAGEGSPGVFQIAATGIITYRRNNATANFTNSAAAGTTQPVTLTYFIG